MLRVITLIFLMFSGLTIAQNQKPCDTDLHKQFDFWEGDWNVYGPKGKLIGTNKIVKMHNRCVMQENWTSKVGPNRGTSYNYFDLSDSTWNQVWIDNTGFTLNLKGSYKNGSMVMKSKLVSGKKGDYFNRLSWIKNDDDTVTQVWEFVSTEGKVL